MIKLVLDESCLGKDAVHVFISEPEIEDSLQLALSIILLRPARSVSVCTPTEGLDGIWRDNACMMALTQAQ